jgi:hypothetical protein
MADAVTGACLGIVSSATPVLDKSFPEQVPVRAQCTHVDGLRDWQHYDKKAAYLRISFAEAWDSFE